MQNDELETGLKSLSPVVPQIDPLIAGYAAGRRSSDRTLNRWRGLTAFAVGIAMLPWILPGQRAMETRPQPLVIAPPPPRAIQPIESVSHGNVWQLQMAVLDKGLDGLPNTPIASLPALRGSDSF